MRFSIIIPYYNSEEYLSFCLDSIKKQTFQDYELILVDDLSNDGSYEIAIAYKEKIGKLHIIKHQENKGAGAARNTALKQARGEYIFFIDSDDILVNKDVLSEIDKNIIDGSTLIDILLFRHKLINSETGLISDIHSPYERNFWSKIDDKKPYRRSELLLFPAYPWNKIFRKDFLLENSFFCTETYTHNDLALTVKSLMAMDNFSLLNKVLIFHRYGTNYNQITNISSIKRFDLFLALYDVEKYIESNDVSMEYQRFFLRFKIELFFWGLERINDKLSNQFIILISDDLSRIDKFLWSDFNQSFNIPLKEKTKYMIIKNFPKLYILIKRVKRIIQNGN